MSLSGISWNVPIKCVHDLGDPNTTILINPNSFQPYCKVCGWNALTIPINVYVPGPLGGQYTISNKKVDSTQETIDAFDRAMGIIGK